MLAIYSSFSAITTQVKLYYIFMLLLGIGMMGVFLAQDLVPVLRLLGIHTDPHVFPDRHVGRQTACLCFNKILPLYDGRLSAHAAGDPLLWAQHCTPSLCRS